ncbi:MAG TPA: hypothetical protein VFO10_05525 [Oligoflexus sp.]|uniref:hypothetical protein n=1 Tax=Oligoflexus sp. TaxID=1971216 RepID=UPI002D7FDF01|nr:hypothetical protein [Oligoflexus sp.]HET9236686.1 hypothetical protein [Oligoflexus sp.]
MSKKIIGIGLLMLAMPVVAQDANQGQVEDIPEGQVEAIHPAGGQPRSQDTQPDLFRFESRLFNPIPSDE